MAVLPLSRHPASRCILSLSGRLFRFLRRLLVVFLLVGVESPLLFFIGLVHMRSPVPYLMI
jgi:hypothetical protein